MTNDSLIEKLEAERDSPEPKWPWLEWRPAYNSGLNRAIAVIRNHTAAPIEPIHGRNRMWSDGCWWKPEQYTPAPDVERVKQAIASVFIPDGIYNIEEGWTMERAAKAAVEAMGGDADRKAAAGESRPAPPADMGDAVSQDTSLRDVKIGEKLITVGEKPNCTKDGTEGCKDTFQQESTLPSPASDANKVWGSDGIKAGPRELKIMEDAATRKDADAGLNALAVETSSSSDYTCPQLGGELPYTGEVGTELPFSKASDCQSEVRDDAFPMGAIENGRVFIERLRNNIEWYRNGVGDFSELANCFEYMADYLLHTMKLRDAVLENEINYNEMRVWKQIVTAIEPYCQLPHSKDMAKVAAEIAQKIMAPYLHTTEPVKVSLDKIAHELAEFYDKNCGDIGSIISNSDATILAKAVLNAVGVKYVS